MFTRSRRLPVPVILTVIGLGAFVTALDQTVVVTALPAVMLDLKIPIVELDRVSWVITAYLLGYTAAMPLIGRMADVYGYSRVYQVSLVVFCVGTSLVAVATSLEWMVGARVIQAIGGGATVPIGMAIAANTLPPEKRGLALGIVGGAAEAGSMLGPAYGGAIVELANWRWIFWLNVPQSLPLFLALFWLPNRRNREARVDYLGGTLLVATLVVLSLALSREGLFTLSSPLPFVIAAPGLLLAVSLGVLERRTWQPLLSPLLFRSLAFVSANLTQLLVGVSLIIAMVTVPLLANTVMGREPFTGALWLLRMTGIIPLGAVIGGLLLEKVGVRPVTIAGLLLTAAGLFLVSTWQLDVAEPELTLHLLLAGLGFGLVIAPIMTHALNAVSEDYRGTAASLVVVARMLGMTLGLAALSAWGVEHFQVLTSGIEFPIPQPGEAAEVSQARLDDYNTQLNDAGLSLFHNFFRVAGAVSLLAVIAAAWMRGEKSPGSRDRV
ncbi:MAG: MFS transporter [Dehalococcoidia bacterium]